MIPERRFNLLDEHWIPVRKIGGDSTELGLLEVFRQAHTITALAETAPPALVALYRLLLAILHRSLTQEFGSWTLKDRLAWYQEGLPVKAVEHYLERWRDRFWICHPEYPFAQVAALSSSEETADKRKPWTQIDLAGAVGNTPMVFDHACDLYPVEILALKAIRILLGYLQFTPGGLVKVFRDSDKAGALANAAAIIPQGATLAQTLVLVLHPPAAARADHDLPTWERAPPTASDLKALPIVASGPNDRYTRQSRAVLLDVAENGAVRWLRFAAGVALGDDSTAVDPMVAYRTGTIGPVRLTFREGRAMWRDLPALVPVPDNDAKPAAVMQYALAVADAIGDMSQTGQTVLIAGVASDQAKILRWRSEQIVFPKALLAEGSRVKFTAAFVEIAEKLWFELRGVLVSMVADTLPDPGSKDARARARAAVDSGPADAVYFSVIERDLASLMARLAIDDLDAAEQAWCQTMRSAALAAGEAARAGIGFSAKGVRAYGKHWGRYLGATNKAAPAPTSAETEDTLL